MAEAGRGGGQDSPLQHCSTAALTAVLFKVSFVQLSAGEEVAVVRGTILSNISGYIQAFTVLQKLKTSFFVFSSSHHLPLMTPPVRVSVPMLCGDLATATAVSNNNNAVVRRCSAQSCSYCRGATTSLARVQLQGAQCSAGM